MDPLLTDKVMQLLKAIADWFRIIPD